MDPLTAMILMAIAMALLTFLLTPRPKLPKLQPEKSIDVPETDVGRPLPVIFGTVIIRNPNVVWFGHLKIKRVKKKV